MLITCEVLLLLQTKSKVCRDVAGCIWWMRAVEMHSLMYVCQQVLASMSTRRMGQKLQSSVLTSLTALSSAKDGLDKNVDLIFEDVFGRDFLREIVNLDFDDFL